MVYISTPFENMRKEPTYNSVIVSQARFGETIRIIENKNDWTYVETPDSYQGWISKDSIVERKTSYDTSLKVSRLTAHLYSIKDTELGPIFSLPYGCKLKSIDTTHPRWIEVELPNGKLCFIQKGDVTEEVSLQSKEDLVEFSKRFLDLPYTWGGRTSFGFDCSGFVQMLYEQINISLLRDAKLQINDTRFQNIPFSQIEPGDLIFWGKTKERVSHVGMYIGDNKFIHSVVNENKPWIRISSLQEPLWKESSSDLPYREFLQLIKSKKSC
jgi:uncharacterized protein YgiM (DUF1202 family)